MFVGLHADLRIEMFVVVTTFYTLDGMKSILLPKFVFFRSRLRLSLKNTNLLFYCFYYLFFKCCTSYYNIPSSLYTREPFLVHLYLINFPDKYCICVHKCKIRHTSFEIYRIYKNCPLGNAPMARCFFCRILHLEKGFDELLGGFGCLLAKLGIL